MLDWLLYLALVSALAIGFLLGRYRSGDHHHSSLHSSSVDKEYFEGLNYLLNEQPDKAIDTFINALEVNSETLGTHLALGKLLRKKGEVERAVRIHQNLLARPGLSLSQMQQAQYELAIDFVKSGLFDRAESLLTVLVKKEGPYKTDGLKQLLEIYQDEKEWCQGLDILQQLSGTRLSKTYEEWAPIRAHFFCELAESCLENNQIEEARAHLKQALNYDRVSVRAFMCMGRLDIYVGNLSRGIAQLQKVANTSEDCIAEVLPHIISAYKKKEDLSGCLAYLLSLNAKVHSPTVLLAAAELIEICQGNVAAAEFIAAEVVKFPTGQGLRRLVEYYLSFSEGKTHDYLSSLKVVMDKVVVSKQAYQCYRCGFKAKRIHWLCPSCKKWGVIKLKKASDE